jgi:hypothetical protein
MRSSLIFAFVLLACGNRAEPSSPSTTASGSAPSTSEPAASSTAPSTSAEDPAEAKPKGKPFELYNSCSEVVTVIVGKDPKAADAGKRTAAPSSSIELPRDSAGNQVVWLVDKKGDPSTHVTVTRGIKRVEVGRSCSTLNAN